MNSDKIQKATNTRIDIEGLEEAVVKTTNSTAVGKFVSTVLDAAQELSAGLICKRMSEGILQNQAIGWRMSKILPYGWMPDPKDDAQMAPPLYEQTVIKRVRRMLLPPQMRF